jgi:galactose-1-phosphate uridylyltransferase
MDFHNMPVEDGVVVMKALARLEHSLLNGDGRGSQERTETLESAPKGFVSIIKNCGRLVGGSIAHGHQQIAYSTVMPRRNADLVRFEQTHSEPFARHMLEATPEPLVVKDFGSAVLLVPWFMRRPYEMLLLLKETSKRQMWQLDQAELRDITRGWKVGINLMQKVLRGLRRPIAYNIVSNLGPGAGLGFELLPYTQEMGGFEHLGLYVCQASPTECATYLRSALDEEADAV